MEKETPAVVFSWTTVVQCVLKRKKKSAVLFFFSPLYLSLDISYVQSKENIERIFCLSASFLFFFLSSTFSTPAPKTVIPTPSVGLIFSVFPCFSVCVQWLHPFGCSAVGPLPPTQLLVFQSFVSVYVAMAAVISHRRGHARLGCTRTELSADADRLLRSSRKSARLCACVLSDASCPTQRRPVPQPQPQCLWEENSVLSEGVAFGSTFVNTASFVSSPCLYVSVLVPPPPSRSP